ncbi:MAG: molybdenum cofactor guanylyltransferase [Planctomycetes bacterium]|nr:molybdenum cofactor guanylyltransferase [Planctomycetota bacterium]
MVLRTGGIVLCGGRSRRMGTSKAWLRFGDEYGLQRIVRLLGGVVGPVVVAARQGQNLPPLPANVSVVHDHPDHRGPLSGILAGFAALEGQCDAAFVTSCDQPLLRPALVRCLIERLGVHAAVVPRHEGRLHPLTAVYRLGTRALLTELLTQHQWRVQTYVERCEALIVEAHSLSSEDQDFVSFWNANDPAEYQRIVRHLEDAQDL